MTVDLALDLVRDGTLSREGRVVIPADVRRILGIEAGDHVRFVVAQGVVRITTARELRDEMWAKAPQPEPGDQDALQQRFDELDEADDSDPITDPDRYTLGPDDNRSADQIGRDLRAALGLDR